MKPALNLICIGSVMLGTISTTAAGPGNTGSSSPHFSSKKHHMLVVI
jgi:hypothetical protein